ncbi:MAG: hypothetical protein M1830_005100, partial [Pleopsidium flavum]
VSENSALSDPIQEKLLAVNISGWIQRLWTLQEALLTNQLFFKVSGGLLDYREFFVSDVIALAAESIVARKPLGCFGSPMMMPPTVKTHLEQKSRRGLSHRKLHRPGRECLCPFHGTERMRKFLTDYNGGKVPVDIIILDGKKLILPGFAWAPAGFIKRQMGLETKGSSEGLWARVTDNGLLGSYYCLLLQWDKVDGVTPRDYRLASEEADEDLVVLFDGHLEPETEAGVIPSYDVLVIPRWGGCGVAGGDCVLSACFQ